MRPKTPTDPRTLALFALATTLDEPRRAQRFLDLTGIGTDELRARADDPRLLAALIAFLEAHEPDMLAVCEAAAIAPQDLADARRQLEEDS